MKLLVLGGTKFLGRGVVDAGLARGHEVTLFNRGRTAPDLYPQVEHLVGDRDGDLAALEGRSWDAVVDPSAYVPRIVRASAELLVSSVAHYIFISSISVYREPLEPGFDEDAPLATLDAPTEDVTGTSYGPLKALCEEVVRDVYPASHANVRAGLIVGPHDPTGRFTYWPIRIAAGGDVLAPADPDRHVQFVDVRDLGAWIVQVAEERIDGSFNATGPAPAITMAGLLEACRRVAGSDANLIWVDEGFLLTEGAGPWMELPLWLPEAENALLQADVSRAVAAGLAFRPFEETVRDTLQWAQSAEDVGPLVRELETGEAGMRPEREKELLEAWGART